MFKSQPGKLEVRGVVYDAEGNVKGHVTIQGEATPEQAQKLGLSVEETNEVLPDGDCAHQHIPPQRQKRTG